MPKPPPHPAPRWAGARATAAWLVPWLVPFLLGWVLLDLIFNLRWPPGEHPSSPRAWLAASLPPSWDVAALFGGFALLGWQRRALSPALLRALAAAVFLVGLLRAGDLLVGRAYYRPLNLTLDVPLLPEFARLLASTLPARRLLLGGAATLLLGALLLLAIDAALRHAQRTLGAYPSARALVVVVMATSAALGRFAPTPPSVLPLLGAQVRFAVQARRLRRDKSREIRATQDRLARLPSGLEKLAGADVLLLIVESYGTTVFTRPGFAAGMAIEHDRFAAQIAHAGFGVATSTLAAPIQGGGSWLAHATLAAGVHIGDGLAFAVLQQTDPPPQTMAWFFQQAGYRTVLVQPGTTRPWPEGEVVGFQQKYYAPALGYRGPPFGWATMPDQYVVDFVHRQEIARAQRPLFVEYALVSSHAPWSLQPAVVEDWSRLGDGSLFHALPPVRFPVVWQRLEEGGDAYLASLIYDFRVLGAYLPRLARDTLVIVLGDHQPVAGVTGNDPSPAVPIHVLSRNLALLDPFLADGYSPGMRPTQARAPAPMESFLGDLLARLSQKQAREEPGGNDQSRGGAVAD